MACMAFSTYDQPLLIVLLRNGSTQLPVDISTATTLTIYLTDPEGTVTAKTATLYTDGSDGMMKYQVNDDLLSIEGLWRIQGFAVVGGLRLSGMESTFEVKASRYGDSQA